MVDAVGTGDVCVGGRTDAPPRVVAPPPIVAAVTNAAAPVALTRALLGSLKYRSTPLASLPFVDDDEEEACDAAAFSCAAVSARLLGARVSIDGAPAIRFVLLALVPGDDDVPLPPIVRVLVS